MITEIAQASAQIFHLADDVLRQAQSRRLDAATAQAHDDLLHFKDDLLARRLDDVNLRLAGLQHGIPVDLTASECDRLRALTTGLDGLSLLGLYARGRAVDLADEFGDILRATASTVTTGEA